MATSDSTCWTVIDAAAAGGGSEREEFASRYEPVVRAYLAARWRMSSCLGDVEDAVQDVFLACFQPAGVLDRADRGRGFRPFFYGLVRNVALRLERQRGQRRKHQASDNTDMAELPDDAETLSRVFDRAWATALVREAIERMKQRAHEAGEAAGRRVELLRLRFHDQLPIREIAAHWDVDPAWLHHEYATARKEFKAALFEVAAFHHPGSPGEVERECASLLALF